MALEKSQSGLVMPMTLEVMAVYTRHLDCVMSMGSISTMRTLTPTACTPTSLLERDIDLKTVVETGALKDLSVRVRYAEHAFTGDSVKQLRITTEFPFDRL